MERRLDDERWITDEDDISAAESSFLSSRPDDFRPAARVVRKPGTQPRGKTPADVAQSPAALVGEIVERNVDSAHPTAPTTVSAPHITEKTGFPVARREIGASRADTGDALGELRREGAQSDQGDIDRRVRAMDPEEVSAALSEVRERLGSELTELLRLRGASKLREKQDRAETAELSEEDKTAWMKDVSQTIPSEEEMKQKILSHEAPLGPAARRRFNLDGLELTHTEMQDLPTNLGLHHHGLEPELAGYTVPELLLLCRSSFTRQRVIALQTLRAILSNRQEPHNLEVDTIRDAALYVIRKAEDGILAVVTAALGHFNNVGVLSAWAACLKELFYEPDLEEQCDYALALGGYSTRTSLSTQPHQCAILVQRSLEAGVLVPLEAALRFQSNDGIVLDALSVFLALCAEGAVLQRLVESRVAIVRQLWYLAGPRNRDASVRLAAARVLVRFFASPILGAEHAEEFDKAWILASGLQFPLRNPSITLWYLRFWRLAMDNGDILAEEFAMGLSSVSSLVYALFHSSHPFELLSEAFLSLEAFLEFLLRKDSSEVLETCRQLRPLGVRSLQFVRSVLDGGRALSGASHIFAASSALHYAVTLGSVLGNEFTEFREIVGLLAEWVPRTVEDLSKPAVLVLQKVSAIGESQGLTPKEHFCKVAPQDARQLASTLVLLLATARVLHHEVSESSKWSDRFLNRIVPTTANELCHVVSTIRNQTSECLSLSGRRCSMLFKLAVDSASEWTILESLRPGRANDGLTKRVVEELIPLCVEKQLVSSMLHRVVLAPRFLGSVLDANEDKARQVAESVGQIIYQTAMDGLAGNDRLLDGTWPFLPLRKRGMGVLALRGFVQMVFGYSRVGILEPDEAWRCSVPLLLEASEVLDDQILSSLLSQSLLHFSVSSLEKNVPLVSVTTEIDSDVRIESFQSEKPLPIDEFGSDLMSLAAKVASDGPGQSPADRLIASTVLIAMVCPIHPESVRLALWRNLVLECGAAGAFDVAWVVKPLSGFLNSRPDDSPFLLDIYKTVVTTGRVSRQRGSFLYALAILSLAFSAFSPQHPQVSILADLPDQVITDAVMHSWETLKSNFSSSNDYTDALDAANCLLRESQVDANEVARRIRCLTDPSLRQRLSTALRPTT